MASCEVQVELETPDRRVQGGSRLRGAVVVSADDEVQADGLTLKVGWATHGKGNRDREEIAELELEPPRLISREPYRVPFEVRLPNGPATYHGHYVNLDWTAEAAVDLPWKLDPKARAEFVLEPDPAQPYAGGPVLKLNTLRSKGRGTARLGRIVGAGAGGLFAVVGLAVAGFAGLGSGGDGIPGVIFGAVFALVGGLVLWKSVQNLVASAYLGDVAVEVVPEWARPGDAFTLGVTVQPARATQVTRVVARLGCSERAVSGSGTSRTTHLKEVFSREVEVSGPLALEAHQLHTFQAPLAIPASAPPTFAAHDNAIEWQVAVRIEVPNWPDWSDTVALVVTPSAPQNTSAD